jgi:hypothetical protein
MYHTKKITRKQVFTIILVLLFVYQINAQIHPPNRAVRFSTDFDKSREQLTIISINEDFCDYYVHISFVDVDGFEGMTATGTSTIVGRGKRQIRIYRTKTGATRHFYRYRYDIYRGNSTKKPNTAFTYALPVVTCDTASAVIVGNPGDYQLVFNLPSDTVYACRSGVMCDDNLNDHSGKSYSLAYLSQITLYHSDGSFSGYTFIGKPLVAPGQKIKMGTPIAIVERDSDKYAVRLSTYFLDKNKLKDKSPFPKHTHFLPFFQTANEGKAQLQNEKIYTCELTDEMRMQEMSKREKKKLLKNKK